MNQEIHHVLNQVLKKIVPSTEERRMTENMCNKILESFEKVTKGRFSIKPMFCGSIAKDTWLAGNKDIDLFLLFRPNVSRENLTKYGLLVGKEIIKNLFGEIEIAYAEHPYVRGFVAGHKVEIVPAYDVKDPSKIKSAVDRTPYHVRYVNEKLNKNLTNDVRLLKQFTTGIGVYGSDLKTQGFSGYLCELLIIEYGTFENLLKNVPNWYPGMIIDIEKHYKSKKQIRKKFPNDPLVVIDPVDKNRNVASVLSPENFLLFIKKSKEFLEKPSVDFFFKPKESAPDIEEIKKYVKDRKTNFIFVKFRAPVVHQDVLWPQLRKLRKRLVDILGDEEFKTIRSDVWSDEKRCVIIMELLVDTLPNVRKRFGPSIFDEEGSKGFLSRYDGNNFLVEDKKWVVEHRRKYTSAVDVIRDFLAKKYDELRESGVPKNLAEEIHEDVEIFSGDDINRVIRRYEDLRRFLKEYFEKNLV
ncbi:MAG: CCA tRNA nucleotidyltransferase [Candidatus Aenigmarchaeota archaeon]|nr:CCA tRNA nucleotidyltransferase [Candidatus Aenigmarchaeota archaeon]